MSDINIGVTPDQVTNFIYSWLWVVCIGVFAIGFIVKSIKDMFKD